VNSTDQQLLFGVLALQLEFITPSQFIEVCTVWASSKDRSLSDLLADKGWVQPHDKEDIERLLARKLKRHDGDVAASLREVGGDPRVQATLTSIPDDDIHQTLAPGLQRVSLISTQAHTTESLGRYTLSHIHATGGIGRVWLAHDSSLRREVALKELRPDRLASAFIKSRFLREAQVTGQLEHPGIVPIYEVGRRPEDDAPYYTMRFVRGRTLAEAIDLYHRRRKTGEESPLELRKLLTAFVGVCNAIAYAHSRGVLHRDLKPQNIVLGDFGEVMVLDWGLARVVDEPELGPQPVDLEPTAEADATRAGQVLGTPGYMSPEQAAGRHNQLGPETDVFGLGAILFHVLANRPPHTPSTRDEAIRNAIETPVPSLAELGGDPMPALEAVCRKAMAKRTEDRYPSAVALADEVQRWLADESVQAYPDSVPVRVGRWMRRHKTFVSAAAVFIVCAAVASSGAAALIWREQRETKRHLIRTSEFVGRVVAAADSAQIDPIQIRRTMAESGVGTVREIQQERPEDSRLAVTLARLLQFDATAKRLARLSEEAQSALMESISILEPILEQHSEDDDCRSVLATSHYHLGGLRKDAGRRRDAATSHERAISIYEGRSTNDRKAQFNLAIAANELSIVKYGWRPMEETESAARRAAELLRGVIGERSVRDSILERWYLSGALNRAAQCLRERGRPEEALQLLDETAKIMDEVVKATPGDANSIHFRAYCWLHRARACALLPGRETDALSAYARAIELWSSNYSKSKSDLYAMPLAQAYAYRADLHRRLRRLGEADADLTTAQATLEVLQPRSQDALDSHIGRALIAACRTRLALDRKDVGSAANKMAAARETYRKLLDLDPDNDLERRTLTRLEDEVAKFLR
jgi:eukaryotic-like serine/threonine-protein kinase